MACDFCRSTPVNPCPVCSPVAHAGNTRIRKLPKALRNAIANAAPKPRPVPHVMDAHGFRPVGAPVPGVNSRARYTPPPSPVRLTSPEPTPQQRADIERLKANRRRIAELEAKLRATPSNPAPPPPIAPQRPAQPARMGILTPITPEDWRAAERFVRSTLWAPRLPATVDVVATPMTQRDEEATHPPIARGDFRGLWVAVEAGHLTEAAAIELAASWKGVPA